MSKIALATFRVLRCVRTCAILFDITETTGSVPQTFVYVFAPAKWKDCSYQLLVHASRAHVYAPLIMKNMKFVGKFKDVPLYPKQILWHEFARKFSTRQVPNGTL